MDKSAGGPTVTIVDPHTEPAHALTVAVPPAPKAYASPESVSSLVMLTAAVFEELQVTEEIGRVHV